MPWGARPAPALRPACRARCRNHRRGASRATGIGAPVTGARTCSVRRMALRSSSLVPPHTPNSWPELSAKPRHSARTWQGRQTAFAAASCTRPGPDTDSGKNSSGSSVRQALSERQSSLAVAAGSGRFISDLWCTAAVTLSGAADQARSLPVPGKLTRFMTRNLPCRPARQRHPFGISHCGAVDGDLHPTSGGSHVDRDHRGHRRHRHWGGWVRAGIRVWPAP